MNTSPGPSARVSVRACTALGGLAVFALGACDDTAGSGTGAPDVTARQLPDVGPDGGPDTGPVVDATPLDLGTPVDQGSADMRPDGPPPITATGDALWWGASNGGRRTRIAAARPATERIAVTSTASSSLSSGNSPGSRSARRVLPTPGGPTIAR